MKKTRILTSILLLAIIVISFMPNPVKAGWYASSSVPYNYVLPGARIVVHDMNNTQTIKYYAVLLSANLWGLTLVVFRYLDNAQISIQPIVSPGYYIPGSVYGLSNVRNSSFYMAYQATYNTITTVKVTFEYTSNQAFSHFSFAYNASFTTAAPIYDTGLDVVWTIEDVIWISVITQTDVLYCHTYQLYHGNPGSASIIPLDFNQFWKVQLGYIGNNVYAWTYGYLLNNATTFTQGRLYHANNGTLITSSSADVHPSISSIVSLADNSLVAIYYDPVTGVVETLTYKSHSSIVKTTIFTFGYVADLSAFTMPNNYYGFFFVTQDLIGATYYSPGTYTTWSGWIQIQKISSAILSLPGQYFSVATGVFADRITANALPEPGRPTVWVQLYNSPDYLYYYALLSVDLYSIEGMSYTTTLIPATTMTYFSTATSWTSQYLSSTTTSTTNTQTASALQTSTFLSSLIILLLFILMPSGMLGYLLGLPGFSLGGIIGASMAFVFGKLPLWLLLVIILIETIVLFMYRPEGKEA